MVMVKSAVRTFVISSLPAGKANLSVISLNIDGGSEVQGYFTTLFDANNIQLATGFTPVTFQGLNVGTRYFVAVADFGEASFQKWSDGNTNRVREIPSLPTNGLTLTAMYSFTSPPPPNGGTTPGFKNRAYCLYYGGHFDRFDAIVAADPALVILHRDQGFNTGAPAHYHQHNIKVGIYINEHWSDGAVPLSHVLNQIDQAMNAGWDGVFIDEANTHGGGYHPHIWNRVKQYGQDKFVILNPGTNSFNSNIFAVCDIVSVENQYNGNLRQYSQPAHRFMAIQGDPISGAPASLQEAINRLGVFRNNGGQWYFAAQQGEGHFFRAGTFFHELIQAAK